MSLLAENVSYRSGERLLIDQAHLEIRPGQMHVLLGPNGAGKSTLLRLIAGELEPAGGRISLDERPLSSWPALALARRRAVMMQREYIPFPFTAEQVTALGRLPWQRTAEHPQEREIIRRSLAMAGMGALGQRRYPSLSGGERARVQFARALAQLETSEQTTQYLLLDEPTASLDFAFLHQCLETLCDLAKRGVGVLVILQDPNLALRYGDEVSLVERGCIIAHGKPAEVITPDAMTSLYGIDVTRLLASPRHSGLLSQDANLRTSP